MKILYIAHRIPYPPDKGDKIRSFNTIKYLSAAHDVHCACFVDDPADMKYAADLRKYCREVIAIPLNRKWGVFRGLLDLAIDETITEGFYRSERMKKAIESASDRVGFDAVLVFSSSMGQYADYVRAPLKILDFCDLDSVKWQESARRQIPPKSWILAREAKQLAGVEKKLYQRFHHSVFISDHEVDAWEVPDRGQIRVIGNGVELPDIHGNGDYDSRIVGFVGDLAYYPNQDAVCWFAREIWPHVINEIPNASFRIVGRYPPRAIRKLAKLPGVNVIGAVREIFKEMDKWQVAVTPLRVARGIQNKVLEAMAAARPVVTTTAAATGINAVNGKHFILADQAGEFAKRVEQLLNNPLTCRNLGNRARAFVAENYDWKKQLKSLDTLLGDEPKSEIPKVETLKTCMV